jgi:hypothetical protein|tara:strand:+ start:8112 stop:8468 length:357 start_codon:yes stop_codon:yes gene_type:complete
MSSIQYSQSASMVEGHPGDLIDTLPVDQSQPTANELQIVDTLFTKHKNTLDSLVAESKDSLIIGLLFIVFSLPAVDDLLKRVLPITDKSSYILLAIKAIAVMALYWLIKHYYLSRKVS